MIQGQTYTKFLGNADRGENIIGTVGVALQGDLALDDRLHCLHLHIEGGIFTGGLILGVALCLEQGLPENSRHTHTGHRCFLAALTVAALGIFAKSALHRDGVFQDHIVNALAVKLYCHKGTAHHIGTAGTGTGGGHAALQGVGECLVLGIDGVNGPHLRGNGVNDLVVVHTLPAHSLIVQADVTVGINTSGGDQTSLCIDDGAVCRCVNRGGNLQDLSIVAQKHTAVGQVCADHRLNVAVFDQDHRDSLLLIFCFLSDLTDAQNALDSL